MIATLLSANYFFYLLLPVAFMIGSIPFGIVFTRNKNVDIRSTGSKNIGATNVLRSAGKTAALLTLLGDLFKGTVAVLICKIAIAKTNIAFDPPELSASFEDLWLGITAIAAVLGHMFSIFLSFKGGKGVATGLGVMLVYAPGIAGIAVLVWMLMACVFRYSSLAALVAVGTMPIVLISIQSSSIKVAATTFLAGLIIVKHQSNIKNLIAGSESKIGNK